MGPREGHGWEGKRRGREGGTAALGFGAARVAARLRRGVERGVGEECGQRLVGQVEDVRVRVRVRVRVTLTLALTLTLTLTWSGR